MSAAEHRAGDGGEPQDVLDTEQAGRTVVRGGVLRVAGYGANLLLSVASAPLLIRYLGVVDYGRYLTVTSVVTIVAGVTEAGLTNIGVREYTSERDAAARARILRTLLGLRLALAVVGLVAATAFAAAAGYPAVLVAGTALVSVGLVASVAQSTYAVALATELRLGWITAIDLARQALTVAAIAALVLVASPLLPFFAITLCAGLPVLVLTVVLTRSRVPLAPLVSLDGWRRLARDTLPYAAATALGIVYFRVTVILLSVLANGHQVGYFSAAFRIIEVFTGVPALLVGSAFPILVRAARDDRLRLQYALVRLTEVSGILGAYLSLCVAVGAPLAITVIAGPGFDPSVAVLRIQSISILGTFLIATWGFVLLSLRRHAVLVVANFGALVLVSTITSALAGPHAAVGAAIATTTGELGLAVAYAGALRRGGLALPVRWLGAVVVAAGVAALPAIVARPPALVSLVVATVLYFAVLKLLRAIPAEVEDALPLAWRRPAC